MIREGRAFSGVDAVIDKDLASALLAQEVEADLFLIATDVSGVKINFGAPDEKVLRQLTLEEARRHLENGQFGIGSMQPKVEAATRFVERTGRKAVITSTLKIEPGAAGTAGTEIVCAPKQLCPEDQ